MHKKIKAEAILGRKIDKDADTISAAELLKERRKDVAPLKKVVGVHHVRGGVGKTTIAVNLAVGLANRGWKVLLIDSDPSAGATLHFGVEPDESIPTLLHIMQKKATLDECLKKPLGEDIPLDFIPCSASFSTASLWLIMQKGSDLFFRRFVQSLDDYDYIIVDLSPNWDVLHTNVYLVVDHVIVPTIPERISVDTLELLGTYMGEVVDAYGLDEPMLHIVLNNLNKSMSAHKLQVETVCDGNYPVATDEEGIIIIPQDAKVKSSSTQGVPFVLESASRATKAFQRLVQYMERETTNDQE